MNKLTIALFACLIAIPVCNTEAKKKQNTIENDLTLFSTPMATGLKGKVSKKKIMKISNPDLREAALAMKEGTYSLDLRCAEFKPYLTPRALGQKLHIGDGYSKYEGVTGILLKEGSQTIIVEGIAEGINEIEIIVPNWERRAPEGTDPTKDPAGWGIHKTVYKLKNGVNVIDIQKDGLAYVNYYSDKPEELRALRIHFVNDPVNGYFDITKHNNKDWDKLLENAVYPAIDGKGKYAQIVYPVEACKKYAPSKGVELITNYDSMVHLQHKFIGLQKYNKVPDNRILARVNYNYYMFRDGDGVAYMGAPQGYAMGMVVNPERVISGDPCWGFNHEVGHVHQLRPFLNWGGLGEVSNNIVTLYVTTHFGNKSRISEQKNYEKGRKSIIETGISLLEDGDVFNRLVPFWQLQLYFSKYGQPDFYPDLHEALRNSAPQFEGMSPRTSVGEYQLNFVKQCCKVGKTDLTDFFTKWGFLKPISTTLNDYGEYKVEITQAMIDECVAEIKSWNLPAPKCDPTTLED